MFSVAIDDSNFCILLYYVNIDINIYMTMLMPKVEDYFLYMMRMYVMHVCDANIRSEYCKK